MFVILSAAEDSWDLELASAMCQLSNESMCFHVSWNRHGIIIFNNFSKRVENIITL